jgi:hypothetical protein
MLFKAINTAFSHDPPTFFRYSGLMPTLNYTPNSELLT